ncbi:YbfB/YjiJ family MFS transporter [Streptomyces avicenniae]|uniref:YbfB/YjiJ family MFS transporter n=1 Tax=Streptomyces avicenniae TaxID=500153 RepID=UPI0006994B65|nr:YbfB/YjiJ family MFS transporter [Streptomyces avicenniae]
MSAVSPWRLALGTASALGFARFAPGLLLPDMRQDLGWSLARGGVLTTANGVGYLAGAALTAACVRRLGPTATFRAGMLLTTLALAATAVGEGAPALDAARAGAGLGGALVFIAGGLIAARAGATAVTVYFAGTGAGIVLGALTVPPFLGQHPGSWPVAWAGLALCSGLATALSWTAARTDAPTGGGGGGGGRARLRPLWRTAAAYALFGAGYIAYPTFLSTTLAAAGTPSWQVALLWTLLGAGVLAAPRLWRRPVLRWPAHRLLAVLLALLTASALLALPWLPTPATVASVLLHGLCFMAVPATVTALIRSSVPADGQASALGAFTVLFSVGQTLGPWAAGALADLTRPSATLLWTAALCAAAALLSAAGRHEAGRRCGATDGEDVRT